MDALAAGRPGPSAREPLAAESVALRGVSLSRGARVVLSSVGLSIAAGEFVGVFGPNGSGKTSLLHAILGLLTPRTGTLQVFGRTPRRGNPLLGYLPQQRSQVGELRVRGRDLVASAWRGERWGLARLDAAGAREVDEVIALVGAEALARRPVGELSGGEQQRLLLAQSLLGKPRMLLLDEPLASLDLHVQGTVVELVKDIQRRLGVTVLFTAHDVNALLGVMDRVLYLGHGQAVIGAPAEVINGAVLSRLYDTPIEVLEVKGRLVVVSGHGQIEVGEHHHA